MWPGAGTTCTFPEMRNCCWTPSIHHASSASGCAASWVTFGVRTSVELMRRGRLGLDSLERNERKTWDRTWGVGSVGSKVAS
jgi:hypothetical protein